MATTRKIIPEGSKFGEWTVKGFAKTLQRKAHWNVICSCGAQSVVASGNLFSGASTGCRACSRLTHGMSSTPTYVSWYAMIHRTTSEKDPAWERYGGRGITVCKRWLKFENFFKDMGERPEGLTLERSDNNKGYCKSNCVWATDKEQSRNKSNTIRIAYRGVLMSLPEAAERSGLRKTLLQQRVKSKNLDIFRGGE